MSWIDFQSFQSVWTAFGVLRFEVAFVNRLWPPKDAPFCRIVSTLMCLEHVRTVAFPVPWWAPSNSCPCNWSALRGSRCKLFQHRRSPVTAIAMRNAQLEVKHLVKAQQNVALHHWHLPAPLARACRFHALWWIARSLCNRPIDVLASKWSLWWCPAILARSMAALSALWLRDDQTNSIFTLNKKMQSKMRRAYNCWQKLTSILVHHVHENVHCADFG